MGDRTVPFWKGPQARLLDKHFPQAGPCLICGHCDKRHRLWDALMNRAEAGDMVHELALDYNLSPHAVRAVLRICPYRDSRGRLRGYRMTAEQRRQMEAFFTEKGP
jgi:hypothetical protein